jgi:diguanylate cyclase (GGDEF)-like protein/PAS domain S-box-containing protein
MAVTISPIQRAKNWLPKGTALPDDVWAQRHRGIHAVLVLHVPAVFFFALVRGESPLHGLVEACAVGFFAVLARIVHDQRRQTTVVTAMGLLTSSAVLVHLSGGMIEMHFHYFVMVGVITLYQDWYPFLIAIGYVVVQHGVAGLVDPSAVYNHAAAVNNPWKWAGVHGFFVLAMSLAGIASWRLNEAFLGSVVQREAQLSEAQSVARLGSWERNLETGEATWSAEFFRLIGADASLVEPSSEAFFAFVHPDDRAMVEAAIERTREHGVTFAIDFRAAASGDDGEVRWLHGRGRRTTIDGRAATVSGTIQDVTDRKQSDADLHETLSLLGATLDATADGLLVVDGEGRITSFNNRFVELWNIPSEVLDQRDDDAALAYVLGQVANPGVFLTKVRELYGTPEADSKDMVEFLDGRIFERHSMPQRINGVAVGRVWSFRDVTEQKRLEHELAHQAFHDSLTNLANQALFRDRVAHALARVSRQGAPMAVLFLDLDNFKRVNDSLGHTAGDELLVSVAERLRACLRVSDTAARLGGDEFAILLEDVGFEAEAEAVATRIIESLQLPFGRGEREVFISASVGIAFPEPATTADQLLSEADLAMYTAKRRGKNRWETYRTDMHAAVADRLELEGDLRRGLGRDELVVHYQPIVSLTDGAGDERIKGVEALVRWEHPTRGWMPPDTFIGLAEESGLVKELGRQVLVKACQQVRSWQLVHPAAAGMTVSVNVSPRQLQDDAVIDDVRQALAASGLPAASLVLEITETAMMQDTESTIEKLHALKALGVQLAIDDFGTGYSSLSYLQRFPVDLLKIDRAFVSTLASSDQSEAGDHGSLASTIVSLAKTLRLRSVAEGVETEAQAAALAGLGCELAQGYYFARPADADTIGGMLASGVSVGATARERARATTSV